MGCIDGQNKNGGVVQVAACKWKKKTEQWRLKPSSWMSGHGVLQNARRRCLDAPWELHGGAFVHMWACHGNTNQLWKYNADTQQIMHFNGKCLAAPPLNVDSDKKDSLSLKRRIQSRHWLSSFDDALPKDKHRLRLAECDAQNADQQWRLDALAAASKQAKLA